MIALVQREYVELLAQPAADSLPVLKRAEQAMQDQDGRAMAAGLEVKLHRGDSLTERATFS